MTLTPAQVDRAAGVLVGQACGDALGVPYELGMRPLPPADEPAVMAGGGLGGYAKGEYSDDTQMAVCIGRAAARAGADLTGEDSLDEVAEGLLAWQRDGASDIGAQTASVLSRARSASAGGPARRLHDAAAAYARSHPRSAGNGALMRTSVVALPHLGDTAAIADAARRVAELTHADPLAGDSCVLWCAGVDTAVREGNFDGVRRGLDLLPATRRDAWAGWLDEAENHPPAHFAGNGYTVIALQAAWSAITHTPVPDLDPPVGRFPACTCRTLCRPPSAPATTRTPSPPSPAGCSARANPNLHFAIDDAARTVASLKEEGHRVLLHCIWTESRTPTVAAR